MRTTSMDNRVLQGIAEVESYLCAARVALLRVDSTGACIQRRSLLLSFIARPQRLKTVHLVQGSPRAAHTVLAWSSIALQVRGLRI